MKKTLLIMLTTPLVLMATLSSADQVRDWRDLDAVHGHVTEAIKEMERASAANHYDMAGHGKKAEVLLREAEHELSLAVDAAKVAH